jgi:hypothetical protein
MNPVFIQTLQRTLVGAAAVSMLAMFAPPTGNTQGIKATATTATPKGAVDPYTLQKQLQALEKRVLELEKEALETADDAADSDAAAAIVDQRLRDGDVAVKQLTARLASVEKNASDDKSDAGKGNKDGADDDKPMTVTAPFLVVDEDGKPLLRVGEDDGSFSRGLYVFNDKGASVAHMGARLDGLGRVYVSKPNTTPTAVLSAQPEGGALLLGNGSSDLVVLLNIRSLSFMSDSKATLALFGTKDRAKGYLELNDSSGTKMVEAGMLNNNKGYVLASPYRATVDPHGDPSVLKGAGK